MELARVSRIFRGWTDGRMDGWMEKEVYRIYFVESA